MMRARVNPSPISTPTLQPTIDLFIFSSFISFRHRHDISVVWVPQADINDPVETCGSRLRRCFFARLGGYRSIHGSDRGTGLVPGAGNLGVGSARARSCMKEDKGIRRLWFGCIAKVAQVFVLARGNVAVGCGGHESTQLVEGHRRRWVARPQLHPSVSPLLTGSGWSRCPQPNYHPPSSTAGQPYASILHTASPGWDRMRSRAAVLSSPGDRIH
jgi:hypothetical protein